MFYLLTKKGHRIPITRDNIVAQCPTCGIYHHVDIIDLAAEYPGDVDYGTKVYCSKCTQERHITSGKKNKDVDK